VGKWYFSQIPYRFLIASGWSDLLSGENRTRTDFSGLLVRWSTLGHSRPRQNLCDPDVLSILPQEALIEDRSAALRSGG
jgi:hypothetical protein